MTESGSKNNNRLNKYLGKTARHLRKQHHLTIAEVSQLVGISLGMLSKIENGQTSASIETLEGLSNALGVTLSRLFQGYNKPLGAAQYVKGGQGLEVVRGGTKSGHTYHLLAYDQGAKKSFEPFLITLEKAEEFPDFEHPGTEFIYMLKGQLEYKVGDELFMLHPGDALTFSGELTHRPSRLLNMPIQFLSVIYHESTDV